MADVVNTADLVASAIVRVNELLDAQPLSPMEFATLSAHLDFVKANSQVSAEAGILAGLNLATVDVVAGTIPGMFA